MAFTAVLVNLCLSASLAFAASDLKNGKQMTTGAGSFEENKSVLTVTPREIDLGSIKPGESVFGEFSLKNLVRQNLEWSATCPEEWEASGGKALKGMVSDEPAYLNMELNVSDHMDISADKAKASSYRATIKMESGGKEFACHKDLKAGIYRKEIKIWSAGGQRTIHLGFRIRALQEIPSIRLNPQRLDLGAQLPGRVLSRRIALTNRGREMLRWSVNSAQKVKHPVLPGELPRERYVSFRNDQISEPGKYAVPEYLKDSMELIGKWSEKNGYPMTRGNTGALKYKFSGTGISLFLQSHTEEGNCQIYLDENLLNLPEILSGEWENKEIIVAEKLADGPHVISIVIKDGSLELEGVKVFGKDIRRGPKGWISVFPNSGTTLSETDYINIRVDTSNLEPGYYGDEIIFRSNAGEEKAEVFVDVLADAAPKIIDVYLYSNNYDYLYTADPQAESRRLIQSSYIKEGIAFRLFAPNTPGTMSFYRWYNPTIHDHFYHYDRTGGGKKLNGYVYEGIIGNIATSHMTNTRELYRWYNPSTMKYYYSTNPKAATGVRKGYRFDGIAGYVR